MKRYPPQIVSGMTPEQTMMYIGEGDGTQEFDSVEEFMEWKSQHGQ